MKKYLIILFALLSPVWVSAQTGIVRGTVFGSQGESLIGANVILTSTLLGSAADAEGKYFIRKVPPGTYTLRVSMIGYTTAERRVEIEENAIVTIDITLQESILKTEEVVVTAGKRRQSLEDVPVSIAVLESRDIESRPLLRLDDALRYIPGVNITESQINVRGSSGYSRALGSRVLVLVDGIPLLTGDAGEVKFDAIPMYAIERIEVVKGAGSALYGSSALGGVINVITKEPRELFFNTKLYTGMYDNPYYDEWKWWGSSPRFFNGIDVQHGNVLDDLTYIIHGGVRNNQQYRRNDDYLRMNAGGKLAYKLAPEKRATLAVNYASDDHGNWIYWESLANALVPPFTSDLTERVISTKMQVAGTFSNVVSSRFAYDIKGSYYRTFVDLTSDLTNFDERPEDRVQSTADSYMLEGQGSYAVSSKDILTAGVNLTYNAVDALSYGNRYGSSIALYAQNDFKFFDNVNLSAGLRYDITKIDVEASDGQLNPKLGVAWQPLEGTTLRASAGTGFRAPSIAERYTTAAAGPIRTKPNPNLQSERSVSYEFGVKQVLPIPVILDGAIFYSDYENLVEPVYDPSDGKIVFENITKARIYGFELGVQASIIPQFFTMSAGYTFMEPQDLTTDTVKILKYRPKHLLYINGSLTYAGFTLGGDFRFVSQIKNIDAALSFLIKDADQRVPTYVTDLRLAYDFRRLDLPFEAMFSVGNVFQYNYSEIVGNVAPIRHYQLTIDVRI